MRRLGTLLSLAIATVPALPWTAQAALTVPSGFRDSLIVGGLGLPVAMDLLPGVTGSPVRVLVLDQKLPRVRVVANGQIIASDPIGTIQDVDWVAGERGALSLAVDPRWPEKPYVYTHYTSTSQAIHIARYRMTGDLMFTGTGVVAMDPASRLLLVNDVPDSNTNHNGGSLRFGPDGMLYASLGDDQRGCLAQDVASLAGKILRLDVSRLPDTGGGPVPRALVTPPDNPNATSPDSNHRLVLATGLRNPFRMHIDPLDGAVFVADVGQVTHEEVNRITGPANLGWPWYENTTPYTSCGGPPPGNLTFPIATLVNPPSRSIVSLGVYRAPAGAVEPFPVEYEGDYFFSDYFSGVVRRIGWDGSQWVPEPAPGQPTASDWATGALQVVDAKVGPDGALWYLIQGVDFTYDSGMVRRLTFVGDPDTTVAVTDGPQRGVEFAVPRPNPASDEVRFTWTLPVATEVSLEILDLGGRSVRRLVRRHGEPGRQAATWDGRDGEGRRVRPGMYLARLRAAGVARVRRVVLAH